ncbi:hypothetical protein PFISCL1PPCAC_3601, partial [Pristionchus fissidentatus]
TSLYSSTHPPLLLPLRTTPLIRMFARCAVLALLVAAALAQDAAPVEGSGAAAPAVAAADAAATTPATVETTTVAAGDKCEAWKVCSANTDCGTGGTCLGAFIGKCNCNACMNFWLCKEDGACGGLEGACDKKAGVCKCWEALEKLGFPFLKAATDLCNKKECTPTSTSCHGLPCNTGRCVCKA